MKKIFLLFLLFFCTMQLASAQNVMIGDYSIGVDEEVTVPIMVFDAEIIAGGVVKITFDPAVVSAEEAVSGDFLAFMPLIDNSDGWVKLVAASANAVNKDEAVLARIVFKGAAVGATDIRIEYASLNDADGKLPTPELSNGSIEVHPVSDKPPGSIQDLEVKEKGDTWINWTWTNPDDDDFSHTIVYLDGSFAENTSNSYYKAKGLLPGTTHTIGTQTVDIRGTVNTSWVNNTATTEKFSPDTFEISLSEGWNLISIPVTPEDPSISSVLSAIPGNYSIVWAYDAGDAADPWKKYDPSVPFGNDLTTLNSGKGYWIMMTSNDILSVTGTLGENVFALEPGWNLIGYDSLSSQPIADALALVDGDYSIVWAYDAGDSSDPWKKYDPSVPFGNDLLEMEPGRGYWIMMS